MLSLIAYAGGGSLTLSASGLGTFVAVTNTPSGNTNSITITPSGGTGPYTCLWTFESQSGLTSVSINDTLALTTRLDFTGFNDDGNDASGSVRCTVYDTLGNSGYIILSYSIVRITI